MQVLIDGKREVQKKIVEKCALLRRYRAVMQKLSAEIHELRRTYARLERKEKGIGYENYIREN